MGKDDIQFIPAPKAELFRWWGQLDQFAQERVKAKVGHLLSLIQITVRPEVIQAMAHFWCLKTTTFMFGGFELTPTLEEYSIITGMPLEKKLVKPSTGSLPWQGLARLLGTEIHVMRQILEGNNNTCPLEFMNACFQNQPMTQKSEIFLLGFFGFIIFPHQRNVISPKMAWIVDQILRGQNYVNMILTETFLSFNRFKDNTEKIMRASPEILQVWFFSHLSEFQGFMRSSGMNDFENPLQKFMVLGPYIPNQSCLNWINFLRDPAPEAFQWCAGWFYEKRARFAFKHRHPIPLLGLTGAFSYFPQRVARQYGALQEIPPSFKKRTPPLLFTHRNFEYMVDIYEEAWNKCHRKRIVVPEGLEGEEKAYHASMSYIHNHRISTRWKPLVPHLISESSQHEQAELMERDSGMDWMHTSEPVQGSRRSRKNKAPRRI